MEKKYRIVNERTCIEREYVLKKLTQEEIIDLKYDYDKRIKMVKDINGPIKLPDNEKLFSVYADIDYENNLILTVHSRENWRINKIKEIKKLLHENGYKISGYSLDLTEDNWIKIDGEFSFSKENLLNIEKIIGAKDFEIGFDDWMGQSFIFYKL